MEKRSLFTLFFSIFAAILGLGILSPLLPSLAEDLGATGFLGRYDIFRLCYFPCDYYASFIGTIVLFMVPLCDDFITLLLVNVLIGIGVAISMPVATDIAVVIGKKVGIGSGMGIFNTTISIGIIIAPLMSGVVMDHAGINSVFYFI